MKEYLPDSLTLPDGTLLNHRCSVITGLDVSYETLKAAVRKRKGRIRKVEVLSRRLRNRLDLHGKRYRPSVWAFSNLDLHQLNKELKNE